MAFSPANGAMSAPSRIPPLTKEIGTRTFTFFFSPGRSSDCFWMLMRSHRGRGVAPGSLAASADGAAATAFNNRSASSTVIFPCANKSSTRRVSSLMIVLCFLETAQHIVHVDLAALEARQQFAGGDRPAWRRNAGRHLGEGQQRADPVQSVLDRGVADAEELLHLLDGAVAADECGDEDLVFGGEAAEGRQVEPSLDGNVLVDQPHALNQEARAAGQLRQGLPVSYAR